MVTGQDVEPDPDREGRWRIARRVAKNRTISTVDPQARHGHKTRTRKRDGYKAHIAAEPQTGLITAVALTPANTPDAEPVAGLVAGEPPGTEIVADSAYASGPTLATFDNNSPHTHRQTHRTQTPHQRRLPPRRLRDRHRSPNSDLPRPPHHPHTPRRHRPLLQMVQRLPPAHPVHHLGTGTHHHNRPTPRPTRARTKPDGPKTKRRTPTGPTGRPSNGPSPGSPATTPDAYPTED